MGRLAVWVGDLDGNTIDEQRILAVTQRQVANPAIGIAKSRLAALDGLDPLVDCDAGEIFGQRRMGFGLAHEQEMPLGRPYCLADRLRGI